MLSNLHRARAATLGLAAIGLTGLLLSSAPLGGSASHATGVRVEYVDRDGNWEHIESTVHLVNTSATQSITLSRLAVLGPGGRNDTLGVHPGAAGLVLPPLGEARFAIDTSITGVVAQTQLDDPGARNVLVLWEGAGDTLRMTSTIRWYWPSGYYRRTHVIEEGYAVAP